MSVYDTPRYADFIDQIRANPDDDNIRLVCSDYLEESGEAERAEFIRCQVWAAELERNSGGRLPVINIKRGVGSATWIDCEKISELGEERLNVRKIGDSIAKRGNVVHVRYDNKERDCIVALAVKNPRVRSVNGEIRAGYEYVLQHAPACETRDRWRALKAREAELWHYGSPGTWVDRMNSVMECYHCIPEETISNEKAREPILIYTRGFCERITIRAADWDAHGTEIMRRNPVRSVVITGAAQPMGIVHHIDGNANNNDPANLYHGRR